MLLLCKTYLSRASMRSLKGLMVYHPCSFTSFLLEFNFLNFYSRTKENFPPCWEIRKNVIWLQQKMMGMKRETKFTPTFRFRFFILFYPRYFGLIIETKVCYLFYFQAMKKFQSGMGSRSIPLLYPKQIVESLPGWVYLHCCPNILICSNRSVYTCLTPICLSTAHLPNQIHLEVKQKNAWGHLWARV